MISVTLSIGCSEYFKNLDFPTELSLEIIVQGPKKRKISSERQFFGVKSIKDAADAAGTVAQITTRYNQRAEEHARCHSCQLRT